MVFALIMLSLVLLVGYAGQMSLAQMTFVGLGAFSMGKYFGGASAWGILLAALVAGAVGASALPALRLQGLYLALSTFAFAQGMSILFFQNGGVRRGRQPGRSAGSTRPPARSSQGDTAYFVILLAIPSAPASGWAGPRRGPSGACCRR